MDLIFLLAPSVAQFFFAVADPAWIRYVPAQEIEDDLFVPLKWEPSGDKTLIQVDMASLNPEQGGSFEVMSLYKYLLTLERIKKVTSYELSYSKCSRKVDGGQDSFQVEASSSQSYKCLPDLQKSLTCKTCFFNSAKVIEDGAGLLVVFRWRAQPGVERFFS